MDLDPLLLKALAGENVGEKMSLQEVLFSQLESKDPTAAMLAKYLTQSSDDDDEVEIDDEVDDNGHAFEADEDSSGSDNYDSAEVEAAFEQQANRLELVEDKLSRITDIAYQMRKRLNAASRELKALQNRNDMLSEALGACYLCWGEDRECEVCSGRGLPGASAPVAEKYQRYVAPVNQRLQQQSARGQPAERASPNFHQPLAPPLEGEAFPFQ